MTRTWVQHDQVAARALHLLSTPPQATSLAALVLRV
jgi:hypothetical protein